MTAVDWKFDIHPQIVANADEIVRWEEWGRLTKSIGDQLVTEGLTRDQYPGTDEGWERLEKADEVARRVRARKLPPLREPQGTPLTSIPAAFQEDPPDWLQETPAFDEAVEWASDWLKDHDRKGLLIVGPVGVGKTGIATWVARICGEPTFARYWAVRDLLASIKADFDSDGDTLGRAKRKPLLVLDDLGTERPTEFNRDRLAELIEFRFNAGLATVVTTNLHQRGGEGSLQAHLGPRAYSRLVESTTELIVTGVDRRLVA